MSDNLKIIRLATGEELIGQIQTIDNAFYRLTDVAILFPTQENSLGLAPFMAYADASEGFDIEPQHVMFITNPVEGLASQYAKMFAKSSILMPEQKIIV